MTRSNLKVRFKADRNEKGWIQYSPAALQVRFNDEDILIDHLEIDMMHDGIPRAKMTLRLDSLDLDIDSLLSLAAAAQIPEADLLMKLAGDAKDRMVEDMIIQKHPSVGPTTSLLDKVLSGVPLEDLTITEAERLRHVREELWTPDDAPAEERKLWDPEPPADMGVARLRMPSGDFGVAMTGGKAPFILRELWVLEWTKNLKLGFAIAPLAAAAGIGLAFLGWWGFA